MKNKKYQLLTSALILLPMVLGLLLWDRLPERLPTHWGAAGAADGWSGKAFAVFGTPCILLGAHWLCILGTRLDRRNLRGNEKIMGIILMIFPVLSLVMAGTVYGTALGLELSVSNLMLPLMGLMFLAVGNYLPKCRQNATLGVKLPWTLYNEENWNKTHRFAGKVWVLCGIAMMVLGLLPRKYFGVVLICVTLLAVLAPTVYSWLLHKKQVKEGRWTQSEGSITYSRSTRRLAAVGTVVAIAILVFAVGSLFTGSIGYTFRADSLLVEATWWNDSVLYYDTIDDVELWEEGVTGSREMGYGSARLLLGAFQNDEFGLYTRYTYTGHGPCVVVYAGENIMVLGESSPDATRALYETLKNRVN